MANDAFYGMPPSENTRRFTVIEPEASGKTEALRRFFTMNATFGKFASRRSAIYDQPVDQAALDQMREYVMMDLIGAGVLRTDVLPPRRVSVIADQVSAVCAEWPRRVG